MNGMRRPILVFVLSDFISAPGWEHTLSLMKERHELLAIRLWDQREMELPDVGLVWMEDAETGDQLYVDTHDPRFRAEFAATARQRQNTLMATFRHAGVEPWSISTEEDLVRAIVRYAAIRRQLRRARGASTAGPLAYHPPQS